MPSTWHQILCQCEKVGTNTWHGLDGMWLIFSKRLCKDISYSQSNLGLSPTWWKSEWDMWSLQEHLESVHVSHIHTYCLVGRGYGWHWLLFLVMSLADWLFVLLLCRTEVSFISPFDAAASNFLCHTFFDLPHNFLNRPKSEGEFHHVIKGGLEIMGNTM